MFIIDILIRLLFREVMKAMKASAARREGGEVFQSPLASGSPLPSFQQPPGASAVRQELSERLSQQGALLARNREQLKKVPALDSLRGELERLSDLAEELGIGLAGQDAPGELARHRSSLEHLAEENERLSRVLAQRLEGATGTWLAGADVLAASLWEDMRSAAQSVGISVPARARPVMLGGQGSEQSGDLQLPHDAPRRPFRWARLVPSTWEAFLDIHPALVEETEARLDAEAREARTEGDSVTWQLLSIWSRTLLLDTLATVALGGGHATALAREAEEQAASLMTTVRVDHAGGVGETPPTLLRLILCREVLTALGLTSTAMAVSRQTILSEPPLVALTLRGPGVLNQLPLAPFERALQQLATSLLEDPYESLAQNSLGRILALDPAALQLEADNVLGNLQSNSSLREPGPRALLAAFARLDDPCPQAQLEAVARALEAIVGRQGLRTRRKPQKPSRTTGRRKNRLGARRSLREAIRLGAALEGPHGM